MTDVGCGGTHVEICNAVARLAWAIACVVVGSGADGADEVCPAKACAANPEAKERAGIQATWFSERDLL